MNKLGLNNGVAASTVQLPSGAWPTILEFLVQRFAAIPREQWLDRMTRGLVLDDQGHALTAQSPYRVGKRIHYYREVIAETPIPFVESIIYADEHLIVADKPHFLPVAPVGNYVHETLLARLQKRFDNRELVPLHRIDRATAGLVMFSANLKSRNAYQSLFRERKISKRYLAIAPPLPTLEFPHIRATRIVRGDPFIISIEEEGDANSETRIEVEHRGETHWRYALYPVTGKKHQLRVHMSALGAPIVNDDFYPELLTHPRDDFTQPLQLLAESLSFLDPLTKNERAFESELTL